MSKAAVNIKFTLGTSYAAVSATSLLFKGSATYVGSNQVYALGTNGQNTSAVDVPFNNTGLPGFTQDYSAVELSTLQFKGTAGDVVVLVGENPGEYV
jgi:hypothetical protein